MRQLYFLLICRIESVAIRLIYNFHDCIVTSHPVSFEKKRRSHPTPKGMGFPADSHKKLDGYTPPKTNREILDDPEWTDLIALANQVYNSLSLHIS